MPVGQPIVVPPAPVGLGDLAILLRVEDGKNGLQRDMEACLKIRAELDERLALVGKAEEIPALHAAATTSREEAERAVRVAQSTAAGIVEQAKIDAAEVKRKAQAKLVEANGIKAKADEDALAQSDQLRRRETAIEEAEAVCVSRAAELAADRAEFDRERAAFVEMKADVEARAAKLKAALA